MVESNNIQKLKDNETLKAILRDSMGGIMYNVANKNKYDSVELLKVYNSLNQEEKETLGGIIEGAIKFITEDY